MKKIFFVVIAVILLIVVWDYFRSDTIPDKVTFLQKKGAISGFIFPKYVLRDNEGNEYVVSKMAYEDYHTLDWYKNNQDK